MSYFREFKEIFIFSSDEKKLAIVIFIVILGLTVFNYANNHWVDQEPISSERIAKAQAIAVEIAGAKEDFKESKSISKSRFTKLPTQTVTLFEFNPNELDSAGWVKLGFSPRETKGILKYRAKGGKFRKKQDVKKLYCVDDVRYQSLEPFIILPEELSKEPFSEVPDQPIIADTPTPRVAQKILVELNTADTTDLKRLPGIGSYYARKIVEYREELGGYMDHDQLLEIWKFGEERLDKIRSCLVIDTTFVNKVMVNHWDKDRLKIHPYISSQLANMMVNYRLHHGAYKRPQDLKKLELVNDSIYRKLVPYISFEK